MTSFTYFFPSCLIAHPHLFAVDWASEIYSLLSHRNYRLWNYVFHAEWYKTSYPISGDPVTGTGSLDGVTNGLNPGDRKILICSGPFDMAPDESQDFVIVIQGGQANTGETNVMSVAKLQQSVPLIRQFYDSLSTFNPLPDLTLSQQKSTESAFNYFILGQNYPNPFNDRTTLRFVVFDEMDVRLDIFNMAGQKLRRLAEGVKLKGEYEVEWDGRSERGEALPSGVYVLRMQSGALMQWRKLVVLK